MNGMQGLFNVLGGGSMMGMQDMLTPEQQRAIQQQSMMAMAAKLLQAGGPSTTPTSLGQALGGAFEAGQGAIQSGQTNAVQQMLLGQKLEDAKLTREQREAFNRMLGGGAPAMPGATAAPAGMPMASGAPAMPGVTADPSGMPMPMDAATQPVGSLVAGLTDQQRALLSTMPMADATKFILDQSVPKEQTTALQEYQFAVNQGDTRSFAQFDQDRRRSGAARQSVQVGGSRIGAIPPGFEAIEDSNTGTFRFVAIPGGPADIAAQEKAIAKDFAQANLERAGGTVVQDIGRALELLDQSGPLATGRGALIGRLDPVSQASQLEDLISSLRGNIGVDQLQQMRNASPTGGALGNVTERMLEGLQGLLGSLKVTGDKAILEDNLKRISNMYLDQIHGTPEAIRAVGANRGLTPEQIEMLATREKLSFDVRGRPLGAQKPDQQKSLDQIFKSR